MKYYMQGFMPGPKEDENTFLQRVGTIEQLLKNPQRLNKLLPDDAILTKEEPSLLYFNSNKKLPFWTAALTWIIEVEKGIKLPILQLPKKPRMFCLSKQNEVLAHEKVHALRVAFDEPIFEEIIAYRTSPSKLRRYFGPLFSSNKEVILFLGAVFTLLFLPLVSISLFSIQLMRLFFRQSTFSKAYKHLSNVCKNPEKIILCLTDQEIKSAAKNNFQFLDHDSVRIKLIKELTEAESVDYEEEKLNQV